MAHEREIFPILEDIEDNCGYAVNRIHEGESPRNIADDDDKNGLLAFSFKDKDGNVILPQLNNEGAIVVTADPGQCIRNGSINTGGDTASYFNLATITLSADTTYTRLSAIGSAFRDTDYEIVRVDDVGGANNETILGNFLSGPGQFTSKFNLGNDCFDTNGLTGVIELRLRAINLQKATKTSGYLSINEVI